MESSSVELLHPASIRASLVRRLGQEWILKEAEEEEEEEEEVTELAALVEQH